MADNDWYLIADLIISASLGISSSMETLSQLPDILTYFQHIGPQIVEKILHVGTAGFAQITVDQTTVPLMHSSTP